MPDAQQEQRLRVDPSPPPMKSRQDFAREIGRLWGVVLEMRRTLEAQDIHTREHQLQDGQELPEKILPQPTVIRVWVPQKEHKGRTYGALRYGLVKEVLEGQGAAGKLAICEHGEVLNARKFWGSIVDSVEKMPPAGGTWEWHGTAKWDTNRGIWTFTRGEWRKPGETERGGDHG